MSNLTQLASRAQRSAEQAERTAARHEDRVDLWQRHVDSRRPGSGARRRAERQLRHNKKLRDRALERADRHRKREAEYRRRGGLDKRGARRAPKRRWQPKTPFGKRLAIGLLSAGLVTGIAIGGVGGVDPLDAETDVVIEVEDANAPARPNGGGNTGQGTAGTSATKDTSGTETPRDSNPVDRDAEPGTDDGTPPTSADEESPTSGPTGKASTTPVVTTPVVTTPVVTTPPPVETGPTRAELEAAEAFDAALDACIQVLEEYPELGSLFIESCVVDPWATIEALDAYLADVHAAEEAVAAAVDKCLWTLDSYPALAEQDPALVEDCFQDPDGTAEVIVQLGEEMAAAARYAALVDECFGQLDRFPELIEIDPNLVGGCSNDPGATLASIHQLLDVAD